jgi:hypothetical protein
MGMLSLWKHLCRFTSCGHAELATLLYVFSPISDHCINLLTFYVAGSLLVGTVAYTAPTAQITGAAASQGIFIGGPGRGAFTTSIGGQAIVLPFQPNGQQQVFCFAEGCETVLSGTNTALTIIDPNPENKHLVTTATRVLFGTLGGHVIPTTTAYAVLEAAARPTAAPGAAAAAGMMMAGMVAGVAMVL